MVNTLTRLALAMAVTLCVGAAFITAANAEQQTYVPELDQVTGSIEVFYDSALSLIDPSAEIRIRADGYKWTEGPLWIEDGGFLLFSDIPSNNIIRYEPGRGTRVYLEKSGASGLQSGDSGQGSNGLLLDKKDRLILLQQGDRRVAAMNATLSTPRADFITLAGEFDGKRLNSPNDGVYHSDGSLYFTDPPYGLSNGMDDDNKQLPFQGIYRLSADGELQLLDDSVKYPNGIGFSIDEKTLYVAVSDAEKPKWLAYDVNLDGSVTGKRLFHDASDTIGLESAHGLPDGMAVHSSGVIFATGPGGVWLFSPEGSVLAKILTGKATANCSLSADEKTLFMTAHDTLMTVVLK